MAGAGWEAVRDWYLAQMPRYGWLPLPGADPPAGDVAVLQFGSDAWTWVEMRLEPVAEGTHVILAWGDVAAARPDPSPTPAEISDVSFADGQRGWLARGGTILATADGGRSWAPLYDTWASGGVIDGVQQLDAQTGWHATDAGLFRTRDGGRTWADVQPPCGDLPGPFHFIGPATGWIACPTGGGAGLETRQVFRTDDGGRSWHLIADSGPLEGPRGALPLASYSRDLFFLDARRGWLSTAKGEILATADGGQTWAELPRLGDLDQVSAVQFVSPEQGYVLVTNPSAGVSRLLATADGGQTWTQLFPEPTGGTSDRGALQHQDGGLHAIAEGGVSP